MEEAKRLFTCILQFRKVAERVDLLEDVTSAEFKLMGFLHCDGGERGLKVGELAAKTESTLPAVSQLIGKLEGRGLVERLISERDRREVYVRMTGEGRRVFGANAERMYAFFERVAGQMEVTEIECMHRCLEKFYSIASAELEKRAQKSSVDSEFQGK